jgi:hypothetical protein
MNIPADQRNRNLMLWCLCGKPTNFETFLAPLLSELKGMKAGWRTPGGCIVKAGLSFVSGDGPACVILSGFLILLLLLYLLLLLLLLQLFLIALLVRLLLILFNCSIFEA